MGSSGMLKGGGPHWYSKWRISVDPCIKCHFIWGASRGGGGVGFWLRAQCEFLIEAPLAMRPNDEFSKSSADIQEIPVTTSMDHPCYPFPSFFVSTDAEDLFQYLEEISGCMGRQKWTTRVQRFHVWVHCASLLHGPSQTDLWPRRCTDSAGKFWISTLMPLRVCSLESGGGVGVEGGWRERDLVQCREGIWLTFLSLWLW